MTADRKASSPLKLGLFAAVCFLGAELGHVLAVAAPGSAPSFLSPLWPPSGLILAALVLADRRSWVQWLVVGCGATFVSGYVVHHEPLAAALAFAASSSLEASLGAWILTRFAGTPFTMADLKNVMLFIAASVTATMAGGAIAAGTLTQIGAERSFWSAWETWWVGDLLGVMLVAPMMLGWRTEHTLILSRLRTWRLLEVIIVFGGTVAVAQGVWGELLPPVLQVPGYLLPFILWGVFRFGQSGVASLMLTISLIGLWNTEHGHGPYTVLMGSTAATLLRGQGTIAVAGFSVLLLAAVVAERKRAATERNMLVADLQQALAEIKTLEGLIPICAWCHKVRDDAGFWQKIETYLHANTQASFSHGICPECSGDFENAPPVVHRRRKGDV